MEHNTVIIGAREQSLRVSAEDNMSAIAYLRVRRPTDRPNGHGVGWIRGDNCAGLDIDDSNVTYFRTEG
jgi:hypothetical protein